MTNRLADSTSPYLLQHKDNPVDWWQWGDDAFAAARERDVPVLLSVGYAACHWCHVMAHESFEDDATAAYMNQHFICVKVDREERPDVDAIYMDATQAMTGHGGWPMTVMLTPTGEPFYCGTYFPKDDRHGMPSFMTVLTAVVEAWTTKPDELLAAGSDIVRQLTERATPPASILNSQPPTEAQLAIAATTALNDEDTDRGGFGSAPKFPPSMTLEALLRHHARTRDEASLNAVVRTCDAMARGGIYDQLAGGFARYSVDATWTVPHFEKMLYDNGQLASLYLHVWIATGSRLAQRIAVETCDWMVAELLTDEGLFAASLDADSLDETTGHSEEGAFYVWTPEQIGEPAASLFTVTASGTFEHGTSVLQLLTDPSDEHQWHSERRRLLDLRAKRPRPGRDDKIVTAWNGLAIGALAEVGTLLDRPDLVAAATKAADQLLTINVINGRLRRASRDGKAGEPKGVLDDHGCLAAGLLKLHQVTGVRRYLDEAVRILDIAVERFGDERDGGFFDTADDAEQLVRRPKDPSDGASPSGSSATIDALITAAALTGRTEFRDRAERALAAVAKLIERAPRFAGLGWAAAEAMHAGPLEIAVVGDEQLAAIARLTTSPGAVVVTTGDSPLLDDRPQPAAYICRNFSCDAPVTDLLALKEKLGVRVTGEPKRPNVIDR